MTRIKQLFYCAVQFGYMYRTLHIVCLRTVSYDDSSSILSAYSRELGRVAFKIPSGGSRESQRRRALTMPLGMVECVADVRAGRDILCMRDVRPMSVTSPVAAGEPVKMAVAMFMAEALGVLLRERVPDERLFDFIVSMISSLANMQRGTANFHLMFLYRLATFLGVEPDIATYAPGRVFDLNDGVFRVSPPEHGHFLSPDRARAVLVLSRMGEDNLHLFRLNRAARNMMLDGILAYYSIHLGVRPDEMSSPAVLRSLF